jgi:ADP-heptose:LPS heptosyltransferase
MMGDMPSPGQILRRILARRRVALHGDGDICRSMVAWLQERNFEIAAILDRFSHAEPDAAHNGIPILSPEHFAEHETPVVICLNESGGFAEEEAALACLGFDVLPYHALFDLEPVAPDQHRSLRRGADSVAKTCKFVLNRGLVFAAAIVDFVVCLLVSPKERADLLLTTTGGGLGDFIIRQDALRAFRVKYANRKVVLVCEPAYCELLALDPFYTKVLPLNSAITRHPWHRVKFLLTLRRTAFEEVVSLLHIRRRHPSEWAVKMSVAKHKTAMRNHHYRLPANIRRIIDAPYTRLVNIAAYPSGHVLPMFAEFVRAVCQPDFRMAQPRLHFTHPPRARDEPYVVFVLSANSPSRCWPPERFAALTDILKCSIVLLGSGDLGDRFGKIFIQHAFQPERVINQINQTSLLDYLGEIANATLLLGQDSSAIHIAAALGTPSIAVAAGGNYGGHAASACNYPYFLPYPPDLPGGECSPIAVTTPMDCFGCGHECKYPVEDCFVCLKMIRVEQVRVVLKDVAERLLLT